MFSAISSSVNDVKFTTSSFFLVCLGLIASMNFRHAWYSGVLSEKPISLIKVFRLGWLDLSCSGGESISNRRLALLVLFGSSMVLIGIAFPNAFDNADWRFRVDLLEGSFAGGVVFWFCRFGKGATSSDDVVELLSSWLDCTSAVVVLSFSVDASVSKVIPLFWGCLEGRPPVRFPVAFAFHFVGLIVCCFDFFVCFTGRPVASSSSNIACWGAFGLLMSKKRRHGPFLRADL